MTPHRKTFTQPIHRPSQTPQTLFKKSLLFLLLTSFSLLTQASPPFCADIFTNGVQTHDADAGVIRFNYEARLITEAPNLLNTTEVHTSPWSIKKSCGLVDCAATGGASQKLYAAPPKTTTSTVEIQSNGGHIQVGENGNEFKWINLPRDRTATFLPGHAEYIIDRLDMGYRSNLRLSAGNYWIRSLNLNVLTTIEVIGEGSVNVYVTDNLHIPLHTRINVTSGEPAIFSLYAYGDIAFLVNTQSSGFFYSEQKVDLHYRANVTGGISARAIELLADSQVIFDPTAAQALDLGALCRRM